MDLDLGDYKKGCLLGFWLKQAGSVDDSFSYFDDIDWRGEHVKIGEDERFCFGYKA